MFNVPVEHGPIRGQRLENRARLDAIPEGVAREVPPHNHCSFVPAIIAGVLGPSIPMPDLEIESPSMSFGVVPFVGIGGGRTIHLIVLRHDKTPSQEGEEKAKKKPGEKGVVREERRERGHEESVDPPSSGLEPEGEGEERD